MVSGQVRRGATADMAGASATRAVIVALLVAHIASLVCSVTGWAGVIDVDPEVRTLVNAGRARVLVTLLVADSGDEALRATAIGRAQDAVLSRLPRSHGSLLRRYASVPLLSLEIDATALLALERMPDVVAAVKLDRTAAPQ